MKPIRFCWYALIVPDRQGLYRIVLVIEHVAGYYQLTSPPGSRKLRRAECDASRYNQSMGVSEDDATRILSTSLRASHQAVQL